MSLVDAFESLCISDRVGKAGKINSLTLESRCCSYHGFYKLVVYKIRALTEQAFI